MGRLEFEVATDRLTATWHRPAYIIVSSIGASLRPSVCRFGKNVVIDDPSQNRTMRLAAERRHPGQEIEDEVKVGPQIMDVSWMFRLHFSDWPVEDRPAAIVVTRLAAGLLQLSAPAILSAAQRNFASGDLGPHYLAGNLVERHRSTANLQLRTGSRFEKRLRKLF
jgi:hypothetical protein